MRPGGGLIRGRGEAGGPPNQRMLVPSTENVTMRERGRGVGRAQVTRLLGDMLSLGGLGEAQGEMTSGQLWVWVWISEKR